MNNINKNKNKLTLLSFVLNNELFGVRVKYVIEVFETETIARVPLSKPYIAGIRNFRGNVLSIIDLRNVFGLPPVQSDNVLHIVVIEFDLSGNCYQLGLLVDRVQNVVEITEQQIQKIPQSGTSDKNHYMEGMVKIDNEFLMVISPENGFASICEDTRTVNSEQ